MQTATNSTPNVQLELLSDLSKLKPSMNLSAASTDSSEGPIGFRCYIAAKSGSLGDYLLQLTEDSL